MYAKGMTTSGIKAHIRDIYGIKVSDTTISRITDKILPITKEWQQRPLESIYAVVFLDAIHYHVRSEDQIIKKAFLFPFISIWAVARIYWAYGLMKMREPNFDYLYRMAENRGVEDIFIACTDKLTGFVSTIMDFNRKLWKVTKSKSVFPMDDSLLKMLYFTMMNITKKWIGRRQNWSITHAQFPMYFENRMQE